MDKYGRRYWRYRTDNRRMLIEMVYNQGEVTNVKISMSKVYMRVEKLVAMISGRHAYLTLLISEYFILYKVFD